MSKENRYYFHLFKDTEYYEILILYNTIAGKRTHHISNKVEYNSDRTQTKRDFDQCYREYKIVVSYQDWKRSHQPLGR